MEHLKNIQLSKKNLPDQYHLTTTTHLIIKHSVSRWCFDSTPLDTLCKKCQRLGISVIELLNSKIDHPDYQCDRTPWGVALCERIDSPHFKLLYDIYHMQIMEGDIIRTIQTHHQHIAHYHTAASPAGMNLTPPKNSTTAPLAKPSKTLASAATSARNMSLAPKTPSSSSPRPSSNARRVAEGDRLKNQESRIKITPLSLVPLHSPTNHATKHRSG